MGKSSFGNNRRETVLLLPQSTSAMGSVEPRAQGVGRIQPERSHNQVRKTIALPDSSKSGNRRRETIIWSK